MRALIGIALVIMPFLGHASAQWGSSTARSIRGDVFRKGIHGEPAVLPVVLIIFHEPITKETKSSAKGALALDSLIPRTYQIEANAPGLYPALSAVTSMTSPQLSGLKAIDCAFSRKVHYV